jgi:hypothetical protein
MTIYPEESLYWLPPDYWVEQSDILLVLRRRDGSESRLERTYEQFLELPGPAVLGILWLLGIIPIGLCAAALYSLWAML